MKFNMAVEVEHNFTRNSKRTEAEWRLRSELRNQLDWGEWRYQYKILHYTADFAHLPSKTIVEVDGSSHNHREERDNHRTDVLFHEGWRVIRFTNVQIYKELEWVIKTIKANIEINSSTSVDNP